MAHVLRLARGTDYLNLANGTDNIYCTNYTPLAAQLSAAEIEYLADGGDISALHYLNVSEPIRLRFYNPSRALALAAKDNFESYIRDAIEYQRTDGESGAQIFIELQPGGSGTIWRTELLYAPPQLEAGALGGRWAAGSFYAAFDWRRRFYWETSSRAIIQMQNPQGTGSQLTVYNPCPVRAAANAISFDSATKTISDSGGGLAAFQDHQTIVVVGSASNDGAYTVAEEGGGVAGTLVVEEALVDEAADPGVTVSIVGPVQNYVDLPATQVDDMLLPTPADVVMINTYNDAHEVTSIFLGHNVFSDPENLVHVLEAENADYILGSPAATDDGACSGGKYVEVTEAGDSEVLVFRYNLTQAQLALYNGKPFRILGRFRGTIPAMYMRVAVTYPAGSTTLELQSGDTALLNTSDAWQELGEVSLPPWLTKLSDWQGVSLCIYGRKTGGFTLDADCFETMPVHSYRRYSPATGGIEYNESLDDNGIIGEVYHQAVTTSYKAGFYEAGGSDQVMIYPNKLQRLYVSWNAANGAEAYRSLAIQVNVRNRRLEPL